MCRMCIVEVDTGRGPALQPACMLPVSEGMTVDTESDVTKKAQDGVLEFLLINHPLDCPVCDNISPGITWPPKQTTICPLGPSAVSPIASAVVRFRDEFIAYCGGTAESPVAINGKAYIAKASEAARV